jgi:hypothetical protein
MITVSEMVTDTGDATAAAFGVRRLRLALEKAEQARSHAAVIGVPPIRPLTHAAMAIAYYGHELAMALRCDPALFSLEDTRAFLDAYEAQLEETADVAADICIHD